MGLLNFIKTFLRKPEPAVTPPGLPSSPVAPPAIEGRAASDTSFSPDQPISAKTEDKFNRWPFAARIAETLATRRDPGSIVIGIYGPWGDGKSSVLALMAEALRPHPDVVIVRFNPWRFDTEEQLLRSFFASLAAAIGKSLSTKVEELGELLQKYGSVLSLASVSLGGVATISPGSAAQDIGRSLATVDLEDLRERIGSILKENGKRVVVLVDDIDRLDRREIQAVFKLVKLSANFENTSYVLAFDDEMVAEALGERYGGGGSEAGRSFLEKIVQVPLNLPPPDRAALRTLVFDGINAVLAANGIDLTDSQAQAFARHFVDGIEPRLTTPRQAKLYVNALTFALPILRGEVNVLDQMLVEGLRLFYPKLFSLIRENPECFLGQLGGRESDEYKKRVIAMVDAGLEGIDAHDKEQISRGLLEVLFPRLKGMFGNTIYGDDWDNEWERDQRVCARSYFERFFRYAVPADDVPDLMISRFLDGLRRDDEGATELAYRELALTQKAARLIEKLRRREDTVDPASVSSLAMTVARNGLLLPREKGPMLGDWTFMQAGILIAHLVKRLPVGAVRDDLARHIIREAQPLAFAVECFRWLSTDKKSADERVLAESFEAELEKVLAERIAAFDAATPLYEAFGDDAPRLYWIAQRHDPATSSRLEQRFAASPAAVDVLLDAYVGTAWGIESGLSHKSDFMRGSYDAVARLIDPEIIMANLRTRHAAAVEKPEFHNRDTMPVPARIARQFAFLHEKVAEEAKQKAAEGQGDAPAAANSDAEGAE